MSGGNPWGCMMKFWRRPAEDEFMTEEMARAFTVFAAPIPQHISDIYPHKPKQGPYWQMFHRGVPSDAVEAGEDKDGNKFYVGRARHEQDILPARVEPSRGLAFISYIGREYAKSNFQVLCAGGALFEWHPSSHGLLPRKAFKIGKNSQNGLLYAGRIKRDGMTLPGMVRPAYGRCYVPYGGGEYVYIYYETLVMVKKYVGEDVDR